MGHSLLIESLFWLSVVISLLHIAIAEPKVLSSYKVFYEQKNWTAARTFCENQGGHLAVLENVEEFASIYPMLSTDSSSYWIGAEQFSIQDPKLTEFRWVNGAGFDFTKTGVFPWGIYEPNNHNNKTEACLSFYREGSALNDATCDLEYAYICEYEDTIIEFDDYLTRSSTYRLFTDEKKNWTNANSSCTNHGGHLAVIETVEENDFIIAEIKKTNLLWLPNGQPEDDNIWLGAERFSIDSPSRTQFNWVTGAEFTFTTVGNYPWFPNEPNNLNNTDTPGPEECVELRYKDGFENPRWNDSPCDRERNYLCELEFQKQSNYYKLFRDEPKVWEDARTFCEKEGGDLAVIESIENFVTVFAFLDSAYDSTLISSKKVWIGADRLFVGAGDFDWGVVNGTSCASFNTRGSLNYTESNAVCEEEERAFLCEFNEFVQGPNVPSSTGSEDAWKLAFELGIAIVAASVILATLLFGYKNSDKLLTCTPPRSNEKEDTRLNITL